MSKIGNPEVIGNSNCTNCIFFFKSKSEGGFYCRRWPKPMELNALKHWCGEHKTQKQWRRENEVE